ncbi:MAG: hypothetical protein V4683_10170 [Bacteroidota bacterium]
MTIEYFVFKTCRFLTLIAAIIFLFLKYFALPDMVAVFYNTKSQAAGFLPKDQFFYLIATLLIVVNIIIPVLIHLFKKFKIEKLSSLGDYFGKTFNLHFYQHNFENWINLIISFLNILILLSLLILGKLNSTEYNSSIGEFNWFSKLAFSCFLILLIYPFAKIFLSKSSVSEEL